MLAWWKDWYYDRDQRQTTPTKRLSAASQKYRRLILLERKLTAYRNSLVPSEVVELSSNSTVDDDYSPSINEEQ